MPEGSSPSDQPPTAPSNVQVSSTTASSVSLSWSASTDDRGVVKYEIYRDNAYIGEATGVSYTDQSVIAERTYAYTIRAVDTIGQKSAFSSPVSVKVGGGGGGQPTPSSFSWDNANVYFVLTDRFNNGNTSNDTSYGRPTTDAWGKNIGTFRGGDIKGLTQKLQEGYFTELGVNAIWISAPWEQMHGWVGGKEGDFAHYAYHGYYGLDFTAMDKNMGTVQEMREFVDLAHSKGIRIILDVVMNHVAYPTLKDMADFNYGDRGGLSGDWTPNQGQGQNWHTHNNIMNRSNQAAWASWWGRDWIRADSTAGYDNCGGGEIAQCVGFLPDIKTELTQGVGLPPILKNKWNAESSGYDQWIVPAAKPLRQELNLPPKDYMVKWLSAWVEEFGIDGFRADTAKHIEIDRWAALKTSASAALSKWRQQNPGKPGADWTDNFWMTAEVFGHGLGKSSYFNNGFDSVINFSFQTANLNNLENLFSTYAAAFNGNDPNYNMLSYLSSHDTSLYNRGNLIQGGTALLLLPGGVQIFYGDETARPHGEGGSDPEQGTRSYMNWNQVNQNVLSHWQKLGKFRNNHLSVGAGQHRKLADSPYTFARTYEKNGHQDRVVVATGASGTVDVTVAGIFEDGTTVRDAYTQSQVVVSGGKARFTAGQHGVILIESATLLPQNAPIVSAAPGGGKFTTPTQTVTLDVKKAPTGKYTLDGSDPATAGIPYTSGDTVVIGGDMQFGDTKTLRLYAVNEDGPATKSYTFTKADPNAKLQIYFKKPAGWGAPQLYYYEAVPQQAGPTWATAPAMESAGGDWYVYTFDNAESVKLIFKDSSGKQAPGQNQAGFERKATGWYDGSAWHETDPRDITKPTAPTGLTAAAKTSTTVSLSWQPSTHVSGIAGYDVYRDNAKVGSSTTTSYQDTNLTAATEYKYKIIGRSQSGGVSDPSQELAVKTENAGTLQSVVIYYKKGYPSPYIHYRPEGGTWTTAPGVRMLDSEINGYAKISIDPLTKSRVEAAFNNGSGQWDSNSQRNYIFGLGDNTYIPGVNGAAGTVKPGKPDQPLPGNKVTVYYKQGYNPAYIHYRPEGGTWTVAPGTRMENDPANPGYSKITLDIGTATRLEACFTNGSGQWDSNGQRNYFFPVGDSTYVPGANGAAGQVQPGVKPGDSTPPSTPAHVAAQVSSTAPVAVTLTWSASTDNVGVTGYEVSRRVGNGAAVAVSLPAALTYIDSTVAAGTTYGYRVRAVDAAGNFSPYSTEAIVTVPGGGGDVTPPTKPGQVAAVPASTSIALQWAASTDDVGVTGYEVYRNGSKQGASATASYTDTGLTPNTAYTYTVKAYDAAGNRSEESAAVTAVTLPGPIAQPGGDKPYSTNPTYGKRVTSPIVIDGVNNGQWTDDMLIALDMAGDDPRTLGSNWSLHETPMDLTHLWAAWDDQYLYLAWQYVDVTDIVDPANAGSAGGTPIRSMDMPQTLAFDTIPGAGAANDMWKKNGNKPIWGGAHLPDYQFNIASNMFHSGYISRAVNGVFPVDDGGVNYKTGAAAGIEVKFAKGNGASTLWGVKDADDAAVPGKLVDFLALGHDRNRDTFYEAKIPLSALGNPNIEQAGIGVMLHQGEFSPVDSIPNDPATSDTPGVTESNSPKEWGDVDLLTVPFARIGHP
ncbi:carbohydrate binding domain-containing protein [Paenibacillus puerhi]|uniref:carbohydrate binding domain-containing protein n=1 Tax=Paenibacillus puerhi TaxID=2692622 RepID=UPI002E2B2DF8|nr:carbohydrate binding domain-containing protein [Paenibacillus puerhi]